MLDKINIENVLFLDIETVPLYRSYKEVPDNLKPLWDRKASFLAKSEDDSSETLYNQAGIYAEYGKIICISVGYLIYNGNQREFRIKSFYGHNEKELLQEFIIMLNKHYGGPSTLLCAHNGKEFDFPYLGRRILINGLKLPFHLDIAGKKPWEIAHLDTMVLWKFGDYKNYTSINLLAAIFCIPTPKDDMDGSDVAHVYWEEKNLDRIVEYCQKDVLTVGQLLLKFKGDPIISKESVIFA
ncbi:MAG TPA: 3'-5' exonuclease [Flavobacteriales bacterium]|nr:3'-5' exonuclease [Flavobacteriales bacterium]HIB02106.1 3'-5' exonuclease [Phycisphaerales bacterium]HIN39474.1 3'-5' exonuclease [Flavobacteriales bacterium]